MFVEWKRFVVQRHLVSTHLFLSAGEKSATNTLFVFESVAFQQSIIRWVCKIVIIGVDRAGGGRGRRQTKRNLIEIRLIILFWRLALIGPRIEGGIRLHPFRRRHFEKGKQLNGTFKAVLCVSLGAVFVGRQRRWGDETRNGRDAAKVWTQLSSRRVMRNDCLHFASQFVVLLRFSFVCAVSLRVSIERAHPIDHRATNSCVHSIRFAHFRFRRPRKCIITENMRLTAFIVGSSAFICIEFDWERRQRLIGRHRESQFN